MGLKKLARGLLGTLAPTIGAALGGPFGGMAGNFLAEKLGVKQSDLPGVMAAPSVDQMAAIKLAEIDFQKHLADNEIDLEEIMAADRDSAREREIALKDKTPAILGILVVAGFFGTLGAMLFGVMPETGKEPLLIMLGSLGAMSVQVMNYYFGSSAGSKKKTEQLTLKG